MPERDRFVRGMFAWLGFRQTSVPFHRPARIAGETKYPLFKMIRLAVNGVVSFSDAPLRLALWAGMGGLVARDALWLLGDRDVGDPGRSRARLEFDQSSSRLPRAAPT